MRLLLDTHIYLWVVMDDPRLSKAARTMIGDADGVYVSGASIWEVAIKASIGKLDVDVAQLVAEIESGGFIELPVRAKHAAKVRDLPHIHKDPFDRILIAQAMSEPLLLLTADKQLAGYGPLVATI
ncbi:MAG: type II toxin-antitoxin system VapC family toxin [Pseudomonadota bacterium]